MAQEAGGGKGGGGPEMVGCTDPTALNYNGFATVSCGPNGPYQPDLGGILTSGCCQKNNTTPGGGGGALDLEDLSGNSGSNSGDAGIVFGGAGGSTINTGDGIFYKDSDSVFAYGENIASDATSATAASKLGNIQTAAGNPTLDAAPTFQGVGSIAVNTSDEGIWIFS